MSEEAIQSRQNPRVQALARLRDRAERDARGLFLIEGQRELSRALERGVAIEEAYHCPEMFRGPEQAELIARCRAGRASVCQLGASAFEKVSGREGPDGVLGVARTWDCSLARLRLSALPLLLVVESVEKPGNLGALLRTADSVGCDAVIANTAIAAAKDPIGMARAMKHAVIAGREAYLAGRMPKRMYASPSSPLNGLI